MFLNISKKDIRTIILALNYAHDWEESVLQAHDNCQEDFQDDIARFKKNMSDFESLRKRIRLYYENNKS